MGSDKLIVSVITNLIYLQLILFLDAANDVHSSMVVYQKLHRIAQLNTISLTDEKSTFTSDVTLPSSEKYL